MKKILSVLLALVTCLSMVSPASAMASDNTDTISAEERAAIINELSIFEQDKTSIGLGHVDFNNLYISGKVPVYEYTSNGFVELSNLYLLFEDNEIVTLMYNAGESHYQIMTSLAMDISQANLTNVALIYDRNGCYLYDGTKVTLLGNADIIVEGRGDVNEASARKLSKVQLIDITNTQKLGYVSNCMQTRAQANYILGVSYVTQLPYNKICWAATTACIVNYVKGTSLTAKQVAIAKWGSTDFDNEGLSTKNSVSFMNSKYNMGYTYHNYVPSDDVMLSNIQKGYPIWGSFVNSNSRHAVTIYGINVIAGRIMIMNPTSGATTGYASSGGYTFVSSYSGNTFTFENAGCKTW